jgi:hypothetical protein
MTRRGRATAVCVMLVATTWPSGASGHSPTGGEKEYVDNGAGTFFFGDGTSGISWFITAVETALESDFETSKTAVLRALRAWRMTGPALSTC